MNSITSASIFSSGTSFCSSAGSMILVVEPPLKKYTKVFWNWNEHHPTTYSWRCPRKGKAMYQAEEKCSSSLHRTQSTPKIVSTRSGLFLICQSMKDRHTHQKKWPLKTLEWTSSHVSYSQTTNLYWIRVDTVSLCNHHWSQWAREWHRTHQQLAGQLNWDKLRVDDLK